MQKLMKAMHKNEKGFTLVELMVVVVIIGVLVAIAIPIYNTIQTTAGENACDANIRTVGGMYQVYRADGGEEVSDWSGLMGALVDDYIAEEPECPLEGDYEFDGTLVTCDHGGS